jgi:hypothetical protein
MVEMTAPDDMPVPIALDLAEPLPEALDLGAPFTLAVAVTTPSLCDLAGAAFQVLQGDEVVAQGVLPAIVRSDPRSDDHDPRNGPIDTRDIARLVLTAPGAIGTFAWTLVMPAQDIGGVAHAQASLAFSFATGEHRTSLAAWDVPSPVVAGERFVLKVGAKCSACCALAGREVELRDAAGAVRARGPLGGTMAGTEAEGLYWTELAATAPDTEELCAWSVAFAPTHFALPHQGAAATVSFATVGPAIHQVSVALVARDTAAPVADAQVRLGFHRTATDAAGVARFRVSPGTHRLFVWKADHAVPERMVDVAGDLDLCLEAEMLPPPNPYARWDG